MARLKPRPTTDPATRQRELVEMMRRTIPERERLLVGFEEITAFWNEAGLSASPRTVETWPARYGMPIRPGRRGGWRHEKPVASSFALSAWFIFAPEAARLRGGSERLARQQGAKARRRSVIGSPAPSAAESQPTPEAA